MTGPAPCHRDCLDVLNLAGREQGRLATALGRLAEGDRGPLHIDARRLPARVRPPAGWSAADGRPAVAPDAAAAAGSSVELGDGRGDAGPSPVPPGLPIGSPRSGGGVVARSSSSANRPITRQAKGLKAPARPPRCDAGGALPVHYWCMSTHTTPDSRRRKPRPDSETGRAGR